jgi:hypothetical protein
LVNPVASPEQFRQTWDKIGIGEFPMKVEEKNGLNDEVSQPENRIPSW